MPDVSVATKVALKSVKAEILELKKGLTHIKVQLELAKSEEKFTTVMQVRADNTIHLVNLLRNFMTEHPVKLENLSNRL